MKLKFVLIINLFLFFIQGSFGVMAEVVTNKITENRMLIVLAPPSVHDQYYKKYFNDMVSFYIGYVKKIIGHDNVILIADKETMPYFKGKLPKDILLTAKIADPWIRDVSFTQPRYPVEFKYVGGLKASDARYIQDTFNRFLKKYDIDSKKSDLYLDGGNVVDNNKNRVIVTERFLEDNNLTMAEGEKELKHLLDVNEVAIIPSDDPKLAHVDGMAMFTGKNTILVNHYTGEFRKKVLNALSTGLPSTNIIEIPVSLSDKTFSGGFYSACGIYTNSVVTNQFIYVPVFNSPEDKTALKMIRAHADGKEVISVPASSVCFMGGSARCLTWQLSGGNAGKLIQAARKQ